MEKGLYKPQFENVTLNKYFDKNLLKILLFTHSILWKELFVILLENYLAKT